MNALNVSECCEHHCNREETIRCDGGTRRETNGHWLRKKVVSRVGRESMIRSNFAESREQTGGGHVVSCAPRVSSVIWTGLLPTIMTSSFQSIANRQEWQLSYLVATSGDDLISVSAGSEAEVQLIPGHDARWKGLPCLHHKVVGNGRSRQNMLERQAQSVCCAR